MEVNRKLKNSETKINISLDQKQEPKLEKIRHTSPNVFVPVLEIKSDTKKKVSKGKDEAFKNIIGMDIDGDDLKEF